jgi:hypothetical protein
MSQGVVHIRASIGMYQTKTSACQYVAVFQMSYLLLLDASSLMGRYYPPLCWMEFFITINNLWCQ